jgi:hypothetical protein
MAVIGVLATGLKNKTPTFAFHHHLRSHKTGSCSLFLYSLFFCCATCALSSLPPPQPASGTLLSPGYTPQPLVYLQTCRCSPSRPSSKHGSQPFKRTTRKALRRVLNYSQYALSIPSRHLGADLVPTANRRLVQNPDQHGSHLRYPWRARGSRRAIR